MALTVDFGTQAEWDDVFRWLFRFKGKVPFCWTYELYCQLKDILAEIFYVKGIMKEAVFMPKKCKPKGKK